MTNTVSLLNHCWQTWTHLQLLIQEALHKKTSHRQGLCITADKNHIMQNKNQMLLLWAAYTTEMVERLETWNISPTNMCLQLTHRHERPFKMGLDILEINSQRRAENYITWTLLYFRNCKCFVPFFIDFNSKPFTVSYFLLPEVKHASKTLARTIFNDTWTLIYFLQTKMLVKNGNFQPDRWRLRHAKASLLTTWNKNFVSV